jgi:phosphoglycerate dehydrogenase-like enzyme
MPALAAEPDSTTYLASLGIEETATKSRDMAGWSQPRKIAIQLRSSAPDHGPGSKEWFGEVADGTELVFIERSDSLAKAVVDADAFFGGCNREVIDAGKHLRYLHIYSAGVEQCAAVPGISDRNLIVTNNAKAASETIAEHAIAMVMSLARNLPYYRDAQSEAEWQRSYGAAPPAASLQGKTMLVLGLGGIGSQTAARAHALGMRVIGTRNSNRTGPEYVALVGLSSETNQLAQQADVVVNALPLTDNTRYIVGAEFFRNLKKGAYYVSVGRGATTDTGALVAALKEGTLAGAGLDVTDPEPLPADHPLWAISSVIITPHMAADSDLSAYNRLLVARENLRRYVHGEKLLNPVDLEHGY